MFTVSTVGPFAPTEESDEQPVTMTEAKISTAGMGKRIGVLVSYSAEFTRKTGDMHKEGCEWLEGRYDQDMGAAVASTAVPPEASGVRDGSHFRPPNGRQP